MPKANNIKKDSDSTLLQDRINFLKVFGEHNKPMHIANFLISLPSKNRFGNLQLKLLNLVQTVRFTNRLVEKVFTNFQRAHSLPDDYENLIEKDSLFEDLPRDMEAIVYFIRKCIDQFLSLIYILGNPTESKIKIDSIGKLLKDKNEIFLSKDLQTLKDKFSEFLKQLNEISNAYKHSILNNEPAYNMMSRDEPNVISLALEKNDLQKRAKFDAVPLNNLLSSTDSFLEECKTILGRKFPSKSKG